MHEDLQTVAGEDFLKYVCDAGGSLPREKMGKAMRRLNMNEATLAAAVGRLALAGMLNAGEQFVLTEKGREAGLKLIRAHRIYRTISGGTLGICAHRVAPTCAPHGAPHQ